MNLEIEPEPSEAERAAIAAALAAEDAGGVPRHEPEPAWDEPPEAGPPTWRGGV